MLQPSPEVGVIGCLFPLVAGGQYNVKEGVDPRMPAERSLPSQDPGHFLCLGHPSSFWAPCAIWNLTCPLGKLSG